MKAVFRYPLTKGPGRHVVRMPSRATILSVGDRTGELSVWVEVDYDRTDGQGEDRVFCVHETGTNFVDAVDDGHRVFLGTVVYEDGDIGPYVLHVWRDSL